MARVSLVKLEQVDDVIIKDIFDWVTEMEGAVPNHFFVELNFPEFMKAKLGATKVLWSMGELTMPEIQHIGIIVSKHNGCPYCTGAFCTILNYGLQTDEEYVKAFAEKELEVIENQRLKTILEFAVKANLSPKEITDADVEGLRKLGFTDKGIVQIIHVVSDFAAYNRLNLALNTDYDYRDTWREMSFKWSNKSGEPEGDNTRGVLPN
ncbi:hypothetical protein Fleli_2201 [Bernardetia litoralis DSM 6794]|uniref:Peroxidase-related enzyme n=1 Tax=Bernardetia litoralis (strain ATCC 23117 / DSM 6794 / NBRC 15988 / NCIMB 1366 / Fx l1 / Sio-4) TaxID=880071 RepID=I4AKU5_BERLS|nr:alkylhydroperoxidase [Bernardetia litoralis]AFM04580.1 hypothetical protein Fleli_2201 [Bernardetia litoralis DSM 6794]